jgi:hypothetical protein
VAAAAASSVHVRAYRVRWRLVAWMLPGLGKLTIARGVID